MGDITSDKGGASLKFEGIIYLELFIKHVFLNVHILVGAPLLNYISVHFRSFIISLYQYLDFSGHQKIN